MSQRNEMRKKRSNVCFFALNSQLYYAYVTTGDPFNTLFLNFDY